MKRDLKKLLADLESDATIFDPGQLGRRVEALDTLDAAHAFDRDIATLNRAFAMRDRLEKANTAVYASIREKICQSRRPDCLSHWIDCCRDPGGPAPGLGYDILDELIAGVLALSEPDEVGAQKAEQVFYQPTPVRHVLDMIDRSGLSPEDVLVDFGSGLGQVCMLASMLTDARAIGIEIEAAYVDSARQCAQNLGLEDRVSFVNADARQADLTAGTVFHLYTPFTGSILRTVLDQLREQAERRPIRLSTLGPCTEVVAREAWLNPQILPSADRVTVYSVVS